MSSSKKSLFAGIENKKDLDPSKADKFVSSGHLDSDEKLIKVGRKKKLTLELDSDLHKKFSMYCIQQEMKMTEFLRLKIEEVVDTVKR